MNQYKRWLAGSLAFKASGRVHSPESGWILLLMLLPMISWASGQPPRNIAELLNGISESAYNNNYQGTFVYRCRTEMVAMKIVHVVGKDGPVEHLEALNGPVHEIVHDNRSLVSIFPQGMQRPAVHDLAGAALTPFDFSAQIEKSYAIDSLGVDRVARRETSVVTITPKDKYRYGYKLWLDKDTGVVLRSDMLGEQGQLIEQVMFTDIEFFRPDQSMLDNGVEQRSLSQVHGDLFGKQEKESLSETATVLASSNWRVNEMPPGFELTEHYFRESTSESPAQEQMIFSDGLASVSVFIEKRQKDGGPFLGVSSMGAVSAFGSIVDRYQVTVVGDVPSRTVSFIGKSVSYSE